MGIKEDKEDREAEKVRHEVRKLMESVRYQYPYFAIQELLAEVIYRTKDDFAVEPYKRLEKTLDALFGKTFEDPDKDETSIKYIKDADLYKETFSEFFELSFHKNHGTLPDELDDEDRKLLMQACRKAVISKYTLFMSEEEISIYKKENADKINADVRRLTDPKHGGLLKEFQNILYKISLIDPSSYDFFIGRPETPPNSPRLSLKNSPSANLMRLWIKKYIE